MGRLYLKSKQYGQARETLRFALRLSPDDASVLVSLGELDIAEDHPRAAVGNLRKAIAIRPKNPKYLDLYIETALRAKMLRVLVLEFVDLLK